MNIPKLILDDLKIIIPISDTLGDSIETLFEFNQTNRGKVLYTCLG